MTMIFERRHIVLAGVAGATLALPGCAGGPRYSLAEVIRRLLMLASQNAFALLLQPGGFWDSSVARIALPDRFGGGRGTSILSALLQSQSFRDRLQRQLNRAAEKGAERAAPMIADTIRMVSIEAADEIVRGGPQAATRFLRGKMGIALFDAMLPGIDMAALGQDITRKADDAIWAAIGLEEEGIRANPQKTNDPMLIAVFGLLR